MDRSICFYLSPAGDDGGEGSDSSPFRTIARAQQAVRQLIAGGMAADVTVYLRGGIYPQTDTLRFDERDSGRDGWQVSYRSMAGETPVLRGGIAVTGWEKQDGSVWKARVAEGSAFQTLYADGKRISKARLPAAGYYHTAAPLDDNADEPGTSGIRWLPGDLPEQVDLQGAQVFVWPGEGEWNWMSETKLIREVDRETRTLVFDNPGSWGIGAGSRYYLQGALDLLQSPGQFHLDASAGLLYYWPEGGSPEQQSIIAPTVNRLLEIRGSGNGQRVCNLSFHGLTMAYTDFTPEYRMMLDNEEREEHREGLVYLDAAEHVQIRSCRIQHAGASGIFLDHRASHITIDGNVIEHFGYTGIYSSGYAPGNGDFAGAAAANTNFGHAITNNRVQHGGELVGHGCGIMLFQSGASDISHNYVADMPRYGISLKGLRYGTMPEAIYGVPVTWENHWDFLHARDNRITFNEITRVMTDSQDGGMIEAWGAGTGNLIHGNHLHHSGIHFSFGFGIYLDDACDGFTVSGNVLHDLYSTGEGKLWMLIFAKGIGNRICNNLLAHNPQAIAAIGTQQMVGEANREVEIANNIIYDSGYLYYFVNWTEERFKAADRNLYWREGKPCRVAGEIAPLHPAGADCLERNEYAWEEWRSLLGGKYDGGTLIADPLFQDGAVRDYRLKAESPAYGLGWTDIEFDRMGPGPESAS